MSQMPVDMVQNVLYIWGVLFAIIGVVAMVDEFCFAEEED